MIAERVVYCPPGFSGGAETYTYLNESGVECVAYHNGKTLETYLSENVFHLCEELEGGLVEWHACHRPTQRFFTFIDRHDITTEQLVSKLAEVEP